MARAYRLSAWDCLQFLTKRFSDQQVRFVVEFDGRLDEERLAEAVRVATEVEPVLSCRLQDRYFRPRWKPIAAFDPKTVLRLVPTSDPEKETHRLILEDLAPEQGPLVRLSLVRGEHDVLVVNLDHTAGDAASARSLAYLLASAYSQPDLFSAPRHGDYFRRREFRRLRPFMPTGAKKNLRTMLAPPAQLSWQFPWGAKPAVYTKYILLRRLSPERAGALRSFAASRNAWLNDIFLAAYFRALDRLLRAGASAGVPRLTIPIDLRGYLPARERPRIANYSSSFDLTLDHGLGRSFEDTLTLVRAATLKEKAGRPGLAPALALSSLLDWIPFRLVQNRLKKGNVGLAMPPPWFVAMGVLRPEALAFGATQARQAYALQSFSRAGPVFQLGVSTFRGSVTSAVCLMGDERQKGIVDRFLDIFESELPF